jgi:hypothetical protein
LLAPNPFQLLATIRSRCLQFSFTPLETAEVEEILEGAHGMKAGGTKARRAICRRLSGRRDRIGSWKLSRKLHRDALTILERAVELRGVSDLFASTSALAKSQEIAFENVLEVFYSLLTDLLDLSSSSTKKMLRNPALHRELEALSKNEWTWVGSRKPSMDSTCSTPGCDATSIGHWDWTWWLFPWLALAGHKKIYFSVTQTYPDRPWCIIAGEKPHLPAVEFYS